MHTQTQKDETQPAKKTGDARYENRAQDNHAQDNSGELSEQQMPDINTAMNHCAQLKSQGQLAMQFPIQRKVNNTGLPDNLKSGIEHLSGYSMDDVRVHYNSSKPAQLRAHAYAQGTDIHLARGQEKHLPHEAWHVVQQKQGRVRPTMQFKGQLNVNDDAGLEREADVMGQRALHSKAAPVQFDQDKSEIISPANSVYQCFNPDLRLQRDDKYVSALLAFVQKKIEAVEEIDNSNAISLEDKRKHWLDLQIAIENWKYGKWDEYIRLLESDIFEFNGSMHGYDDITIIIKQKIIEYTDDEFDDNNQNGRQVCNVLKQEFQDLAVRIATTNAPHYHWLSSEIAGKKTRSFASDPSVPQNKLPVNTVLMPNSNKRAKFRLVANAVDHNREAVCASFAFTVAYKLLSKGYAGRVEIMYSANETHSFVVVGRDHFTNIDDYGSWGNNCVVVDCWLGALTRRSDQPPQVIYEPGEQQRLHGPARVDFDSSPDPITHATNTQMLNTTYNAADDSDLDWDED